MVGTGKTPLMDFYIRIYKPEKTWTINAGGNAAFLVSMAAEQVRAITGADLPVSSPDKALGEW